MVYTARRTESPDGSLSSPVDGSVSGRTYEVRTYGCQMNVHDSEQLSGLSALQIQFS